MKGGDLYGRFPSLAVNGSDDTDAGRWIATTAVDRYDSTLVKWFGVADSDMATVFPNLSRFAQPGTCRSRIDRAGCDAAGRKNLAVPGRRPAHRGDPRRRQFFTADDPVQ